MIGSLMNVENTAEKLSIPQLQQAMRDGTLLPYVGMPILQQKVQEQKQMQAAQQEQQGIAKAPIAQQILGEAQGLTQPPISAPQQGSQGLSALPSNLPEEYAKGGIIAFAEGSQVPKSNAQTIGELIEEAKQRKLASEYNPTGWNPEAVENYQPWERPIASRELVPYTGQGAPEYPAPEWLAGQRVPDENVIRLGDMNNPRPTGTPRPPQFQSVAQGSQVGTYIPPTESVAQPQGVSGLLGKDAVSGEYIPNAAQSQSPLDYERAPIEGETAPLKYGKTQKEYEEAMRKWRADRAERAKAPTMEEPVMGEPAIAESEVGAGAKGINLKHLGGASLKMLGALSLPDLIDSVTGQPADIEDLNKYTAINKSEGIEGVLQEMDRVRAAKNADISNKIQSDIVEPTKDWFQTKWSGENGQRRQAAVAKANAVVAEKHGVPVEAMNGLSATESSKNSKASLAQMAAIDAASKKYGVPSNILYNVADIESDFNPNAANPKSSALGGFQFTNDTWKTYGTGNPEDRKDFNKSAMAAAKCLKSNYNQFGDWGLAASGYNKGPNAPMATLQGNTQYINDALNGQGTQPQPQQQPSYAVPDAPTLNEEPVDFSSLLKPETSAVDYQKQMQERLGDNAGLGAIKNKLSKMEEEGASEKEKAPWMALMTAGLGMMAGTSPFAGVNIGKGGIAGLKAYTEAQDNLNKNEEKRYDLENQLNNAQRAEQMAIWKHGEDSHAADVAGNRTVALAEKKAQLEKTANLNKEKTDIYKAQLGIPAEQAKTALYTAQTQATQHPSAGNLSDYEGAKKVAMDNPTAPQYAKYFKTDPSSGKPVWDELSFRSDYSKKEVIDKTPIADLYKIVSESQDPHMVDLATKKLNNVLGDNNASPNPNVIKYDSKGNRI